jgi:hypothetical protein
MTNTGLPDPGPGRNPPRDKTFIPRGTHHSMLTAVGAFFLVGGIYYFFAV